MPHASPSSPRLDELLSVSIAAGLRWARSRLGLTQKQAAERAGISDQYYVKLERGKGLPSVVVFRQVVLGLHVEAAELLHTNRSSCGDGDGSPELATIARIVDHLRGASTSRVRFIQSLAIELEERQARKAGSRDVATRVTPSP